MPSTQHPAPVASLKTVKQQFKTWRETRRHKGRIPDKLWDAAAELAGQYTVHHISKALQLNHTALKDRIVVRKKHENMADQELHFFEIPLPPQALSISECLIEMENSHGEKMRMRFAGEVGLDLLALSQSFWMCR